ncbi:hypothetical protein [Nocardia sp. CA-120079]|uniref:hypothetical protein n=1 Tax=Nocardia sp. CA-120079 TaxID=3239974 RepID=UPI003D953173
MNATSNIHNWVQLVLRMMSSATVGLADSLPWLLRCGRVRIAKAVMPIAAAATAQARARQGKVAVRYEAQLDGGDRGLGQGTGWIPLDRWISPAR